MTSWKQEFMYYDLKYPTAFKWMWSITCPLTCCFYCYFHPLDISPCGTGRAKKRQRKLERMSYVNFEHQGRKINRRNSLSLGKPIGFLSRLRRRKPSTQTNSPLFLKLPAEIRMIVYEMALVDSRPIYVKSVVGIDMNRDFHRIRAFSCPKESYNVLIPSESAIEPRSRQSTIPLLQSCRSIYSEALPILYSANQFQFDYVRDFRAFSVIIPTSHFQKIRSLRLEWALDRPSRLCSAPWSIPTLTQIIRAMPDLRTVQLVFHIDAPRYFELDPTQPLLFPQMYLKATTEAASRQCTVHLLVFETLKQSCYENKELGSRA